MNVNRTDNDTLNIEVTENEAGLLLNLLANVSDVTKSEALDGLFNRLMDLNVVPQGNIVVEENPMFDYAAAAEGDEDEPEYNIVVED
jgi:hypothetical protein